MQDEEKNEELLGLMKSIAKLIHAHNISAIYCVFGLSCYNIDDILWACPQKRGEKMIPRDKYLNQLIRRMNNGKIKIVGHGDRSRVPSFQKILI